ncbi:hypothetical protein EXIGLDRAFT_766642 [Exidia glandulosa HHB12029]|uniref:C2H2-type domain-containing protein n=1 Tax=Exidia glandulosa HHB12029 TaxID=1314781 RepID=A0A165JMA0_EXIGL|nr:hypothetical protein EXIGLDRAFT_736086 [Exidia glandulosa HHB12029]KZV95055.1 hypothetical protein EXIGLDRAFT_766642 [Exidia glandulosa HHB12029]
MDSPPGGGGFAFAPYPHAGLPLRPPGVHYDPPFLGNDFNPPRSSAPPQSVSDHDDGTNPDAMKQRKMHPCHMCHKSFDRPSTLRVHQYVHTLQKEHACALCQRRFSVASNLRRHQKKCGTGEAAVAQAQDVEKAKRPRRKDSEPVWIPGSLKSFRVIGATLKLSMPLLDCTGSVPRHVSEDEQPYLTESWTGIFPGPALKAIFRMDERSGR